MINREIASLAKCDAAFITDLLILVFKFIKLVTDLEFKMNDTRLSVFSFVKSCRLVKHQNLILCFILTDMFFVPFVVMGH